MYHRRIYVLVLGLCLAPAGCDKGTSSQGEAQAQRGQRGPGDGQGGHAPANVTPGSHEDWCDEHGLPESQCTLCEPALSAAFKATGDWCEEHGLPESHCKKCNPNLVIVRPAKTN